MKPGAVFAIIVGCSVTMLAALFASFFAFSFNPLFFTMSYIIPLGALCVGLVGGIGFYVAARTVNYRPGYLLTALMMALTIAFYYSIFYLIYSNLALTRTAMPEQSFLNFMEGYISHMRVKRAGSSGAGSEAGVFGYGLEALRVLGLAAPLAMYTAILRAQAFCPACEKFYKNVARLTKRFTTVDSLKTFLARLGKTEPFSYQFCDVLASKTEESTTPEHTVMMNYRLKHCPGCKREILETDGGLKQKNRWVAIADLKRAYAIPEGRSLLSAFGKQPS